MTLPLRGVVEAPPYLADPEPAPAPYVYQAWEDAPEDTEAELDESR